MSIAGLLPIKVGKFDFASVLGPNMFSSNDENREKNHENRKIAKNREENREKSRNRERHTTARASLALATLALARASRKIQGCWGPTS